MQISRQNVYFCANGRYCTKLVYLLMIPLNVTDQHRTFHNYHIQHNSLHVLFPHIS